MQMTAVPYRQFLAHQLLAKVLVAEIVITVKFAVVAQSLAFVDPHEENFLHIPNIP